MQHSESVPLVRIAEEPTQVVTYYESTSIAKSSVGGGQSHSDVSAEEEEERCVTSLEGDCTEVNHHPDRPPHRFHYTFDDRTIDLEEVSHYFDLESDDEDNYNVPGGDLIEITSPSEVGSRLRRIRSQDTGCEESIYFDAFHDEIYPREEPPELRQRLSPLALSILVFYNVSGGPFGMERAVKSGGPLVAILGFSIFPLIWSLPEALVTAELGTTYPEPSGCT